MVGAVRDADVVFSWFALGFSAVANTAARALDRGSVLVSGGWDVVGMPEIGYGRLLTRRGRLTARLALSTADRVLSFSQWSAKAIHDVSSSSKVQVVYLGVDLEKFRPGPKENIVVCIANLSEENVRRKGLRDLVLASRDLPDVTFFLVGRHLDESAEELRRLARHNLTLTGWLPEDKLVSLLARARVYAQPSFTEGFGQALAEAMASGCVPVVVEAGAMPEVVGDTGFYVPFGNPSSLATGIQEALTSEGGSNARERIVRNFSLDRRLKALSETISSLARGR